MSAVVAAKTESAAVISLRHGAESPVQTSDTLAKLEALNSLVGIAAGEDLSAEEIKMQRLSRQ